MAQDVFNVSLGLGIDLDDGTIGGRVISGTGAPGGDTGLQDGVPIGSIYLRIDASSSISAIYQKITNVGNVSDWLETPSKDYVDAAIGGLSWRDPALVRDNTLYANIAAAELAANVADTVDGITIQAGDRLLFTNLTTGNENVYIVSGATTNWTFTEDIKPAEDGDAILIQEGTNADSQWVYTGTVWVQFANSTSLAELGFIRAFIGKNAPGSETPVYSSADVVTQNTNLENAIGELDASIGDRIYTEDNFVTDGETLTQSIDSLDQAVAANSVVRTVVTGITTTFTTVDSLLVDDYQGAKWLVVAFSEGNPDRKRAFEIWAINDGTAVADATEVDFNRYSRLRTGPIPGLDFDVIVSGTGVAQVMELQARANAAITVHATRLDVEI